MYRIDKDYELYDGRGPRHEPILGSDGQPIYRRTRNLAMAAAIRLTPLRLQHGEAWARVTYRRVAAAHARKPA